MARDPSSSSGAYRSPENMGSVYHNYSSTSSIEGIPRLHQGARREVDSEFVGFLIDYAAEDPECPPLFKAYLEEVVLRPSVEGIGQSVEHHLRNPEIKNYGLGRSFLRELEKYTLFDQLYPQPGQEVELPSATIPAQYRPRAQLTPVQVITGDDSAMDTESSLGDDEGAGAEGSEDSDYEDDDDEDSEHEDSEYEASEDGESEDSEDEQTRRTMIDRLHAVGRDSRQPRGTSAPATSQRGSQTSAAPARSPRSRSARAPRRPSQDIERRSLWHYLPEGETFGDIVVDEAMDRTGPDWKVDSWYKGRRQPPLAVRLDTIRRFLAEEDVDRCMNWKAQVNEVEAYLEWLEYEDDRHQLHKASRQTQAMWHDIWQKLRAHHEFERHHYGQQPLVLNDGLFPTYAKLPRSTRLDWMITRQDWPPPSRSAATPDRRNLLPRTDPPRPPSPVNRMLIDKPSDRPFYNTFVRDSKTWWHRISNTTTIPTGASSAEQFNLAHIEDTAFIRASHPPSTLPQPTTPQTTTPPKTFATTRGTLRATLQQTLRTLPTTFPPSLPHQRLLFPLPAATLRKATTSASAPHWTPPALPPSQLPPPSELEPMPTAMAYRERLRGIKIARGLAAVRVVAEEQQSGGSGGGGGGGLLLPRNVVNGGPFVWRGVDGETAVLQDLLRECRTAVGVLKAAGRREPRALVEAVLGVVGSGGAKEPPQGVRLAADEWVDVAGGVRVPRYLMPGEVQWLKFLGGECVNGESWRGRLVKERPRDKYRLFLLFASKVRKLLDDKNSEGLFSSHDAEVEVEDLLKAIHAGMGSSAVVKHEFQPYDACCWLDRMRESGHVRFRLDPACYGVVQRPVAEFFPEHRVVWPRTTEEGERPPYLIGYIADWKKVVGDGEQPDIKEGSIIWNFFMSLAFRLAYTISQLSQDLEQQTLQTQPKQHLLDAIANWKQTTIRLQGDQHPEPTPEELSRIRTALLTELAENKTMLYPVRKQHSFDQQGNPQTTTTWDHNWDWATIPRPGSRLRKPPHRQHQYFSINRWPLTAGYQTPATKRAITEDANLDPAMTYDAAAADPTTDPRYLRPKLRPYREEKVVYRQGPAIFPVGDTRLQREVLRGRMEELVGRAMGLDDEDEAPTTWSGMLASLNPFSRPSSRAAGGERDAEGKLPAVDPKLIPRSSDPLEEEEELERQAAAEDVEQPRPRGWEEAMEEDEDEFELQGVDVAMTGMGEPWMADRMVM